MPGDAELVIRELTAKDDLVALTDFLHRAYAPLAAMGLRFLATHQSVEVTRDRIEEGVCLVAERDGVIVGTVTYYGPRAERGEGFLGRIDVAAFGQFAVEPVLQRHGIGGKLLEEVEARARAAGAAWLALDTAEPATHLIAYYERRGFRVVDHVRWDVVNYPSVVMAKDLGEARE